MNYKKNAFIVFLILFISVLSVSSQTFRETNSKEVSTMIQKDKKIIVLDVRTADEFKDGHIKGALNIDIRQSDALDKINKLDRNVTYIVHCRTNRRSKIATDHMQKNGFKTIYQMMDGFAGWMENNLKIEK